MSAPHRKVATCGWCPTPLDADDWQEVAHHFLVQHNYAGGHSVRFFYTDPDDELEAMFAAAAADQAGGEG